MKATERYRWWGVAGVFLLCLGWMAPTAAAERPNILLLFVDDMGWNDLRANNGDARMPTARMDRLAEEGVRYTRFYAEATCQPARAALLSGRYPSRSGFRPVGRGLPPEWTTLPEYLQSLGYRTHQVGKWHLGYTTPQAWPTRQGFDTMFGFLNQWFLSKPIREGHFPLSRPHYRDPWLMNTAGEVMQYQGHLTDLLADRTVGLIRERAEGDAPWFIYHAFYAPHTPNEPPARYARQYPDTPAGTYRAVLHHLDDTVGRLLDALDTTGQRDNTLVILASDNGGTGRALDNNAPFAGVKGEYLEGGVRTPMVLRWPKRFSAGRVDDGVVALMDLYPSLARWLGAPIDEPLDGEPVLDDQGTVQPRQKAVWWESHGYAASYARLSADGSLRYVNRSGDWRKLFNLDKHPDGRHNQWWRWGTMRAFDDAYVAWRHDTRTPAITYHRDSARGHGRLTGDRFQRTPGVTGFSLGLGIRPDREVGGATWQVLASQKDALRLEYAPDGRLRANLNGIALAADDLPADECLAVILTGMFFLPSKLWGGEPPSFARLFVNGESVAMEEGDIRFVSEKALNTPTWIGRAEDGSQWFRGRLSAPVLYNMTVYPGHRLSQSSAEVLSRRLCPAG